MKKLLWVIRIVFIFLTFAGAIYVLKNKGTVNAGYAVVPCVAAIVLNAYIRVKYDGKK